MFDAPVMREALVRHLSIEGTKQHIARECPPEDLALKNFLVGDMMCGVIPTGPGTTLLLRKRDRIGRIRENPAGSQGCQ